MVTASPCAALVVCPCVEVTCSQKRRLRMRRNSVRKSVQATSELKRLLMSPEVQPGQLNPSAKPFHPKEHDIGCCEADMQSFAFMLRAEDVREYRHSHPSRSARSPRDTCYAEALPNIEVPVDVAVNASFVPALKELKETCSINALPEIATLAPSDCTVTQDNVMLGREQHELVRAGKVLGFAPDTEYDPEHLALLIARCGEILEHLQKAAVLANRVQSACQHTSNNYQSFIEEFLDDYHDLLDPEGVAERHAENLMIENRLCKIDVNYLGHLLVGNLARFAFKLEGGPPEVKAQLLSIAGELASTISVSSDMSVADHDDAYRSFSDCAISWQEAFDEECLQRVRILLSKYVRATGHCLYLE